MAASSDAKRAQQLKSLSVDAIEKSYKDGNITAWHRNSLLREKAKLNLDELIEGKGAFAAIIQKTVDHISEGWANITDIPTQQPGTADKPEGQTPGPGRELWYGMQVLWGQIQIATSVFNAVGEVSGHVAEKTALRYGASPGLAWLIGVGVDVGSGFIPISGTARLVAKGAQGIAGGVKMAGGMSKDAKLMGLMAEAFQREGIKNAQELIGKSAGVFVKEADTAKVVSEVAKPAAETFMDIAKAAAGGISEEAARKELPALMKKFGISWPDLKSIKEMYQGSGKQVMTAQQFYGHLKALETKSGEIVQAAKNAIGPNATDYERMQFAISATELFTGPQKKLTYTKEFTDLLMHWDPANIAKGDMNAAMRTFAEDMAKLNPTQMGKLAFESGDNVVQFGVFNPQMREMYANLLLPLSWAPTFVSNTIGTANMIAERLAAGNPLEAIYMMKGMTLATGDAMRAVGMAYAGSKGAVPGVAGRIVRAAGTDTLIAADAFSKTVMLRASLYADALREAGTRPAGMSLDAFVKNYVTSPPRAAMENGVERALRATYNNDLGAFAAKWKDVAQSGPGSMWFTFMKSPINLVKYSWDRTPGLQLVSSRLWHDVLAGGSMAEDAIGRLTIGTLQGMYFWELAKEGVITGGGPVDPGMRKAWLATHEPYSVKTPKGWVSYRNLDPATMPIGIVADMAQIGDMVDEYTAGKLAMAASYVFMQNISDRTSWRTLSDVVGVAQGLHDGEKLNKRDIAVALSPGISVATGGPVVSRVKDIVDPVSRDARNLVDTVSKRIPGYSTDVPPLRDGYADPIIPPQTVGSGWFGYVTPFLNPILPKIKPEETDKIKVEGSRLMARLPMFPDHIGRPPASEDDLKQPQPGSPVGVPITPKQRDRWQQIYRNIIRHPKDGLEAFLASDDYNKNADGSPTSAAFKRVQFEGYLGNAKYQAEQMLMIEDPKLGAAVLTNTVEAVKPQLSLPDRAQADANLPQDVGLFESMSAIERDNLSRWGYLEPDKPKIQAPITMSGVEIVGQREYQPAQTGNAPQFEQLHPELQKQLLQKGSAIEKLPTGIAPKGGGGEEPTKSGLYIGVERGR